MSQTLLHAPGGLDPFADLLLRRLCALSPLPRLDAALVRAVAAQPPHRHPAGAELCPAGSTCLPRFLVSGWACHQRVLANGRRQVVSFLLPGDPLGPALPPRLPLPCAAVALTAVQVVDAAGLLDGVEGERDPLRPGLVRALHLLDRMGERRLCDQVLRLSGQSALERLLHLLLELRDRLGLVGLGTEACFPLPLTQEVLGSVLGLSAVHVNRTVQHARQAGLVRMEAGTVELLQPGLIEQMADWQPLATAPLAEAADWAD